MKKRVKNLIALMMALMILLCAVPTAFAQEAQQGYWMYKIDQQVLERMDTLSETQTIPVWIWFVTYDEEAFKRRVTEETGMTEQELNKIRGQIADKYLPRKYEIFNLLTKGSSQLTEEEREALSAELQELNRLHSEEDGAVRIPYYNARDRIMNEMGTEHLTAILAELGIDRDCVTFFDPVVCTVILDLPKSMVFPVAMSDQVTNVYYFDDGTHFVEPTDTTDTRNWLEYYVQKNYTVSYDGYSYTPEIYSFEELYTHHDSSGEPDWVLINADIGNPDLWMGLGIIGNRVREMGPLEVFRYGMAVFDVQAKTFCDLSKMTDYSLYDGLAEAIDRCGKGRLLGDLDLDDEITAVDVTILQRCEAGLRDYPQSDLIDPDQEIDSFFKPLTYYSDFNRDGERDIVDATCIQRYLAGLPYPHTVWENKG